MWGTLRILTFESDEWDIGMVEHENKAGFVPNHNSVLLAVENKETEHLMWVHSERLALAFALFRTSSGSQIRIIKNL